MNLFLNLICFISIYPLYLFDNTSENGRTVHFHSITGCLICNQKRDERGMNFKKLRHHFFC